MSEMSVRLDEVLKRQDTVNDGFVLCRGCLNRLVLIGFCPDCQRLDAMLEARHAARQAYLQQMGDDRVDMGVGHFEPLDPQDVPSAWAVLLIVAAGLFCVVCLAVGAGHVVWQVWHVLRLAMAWLVSA